MFPPRGLFDAKIEAIIEHLRPTDLPPECAGASGLAIQEMERSNSLYVLVRLRREARDEIDRLIGFLDASDIYVMNELEPEDEDDDSELEEDDPAEDDGSSEPALGSLDCHHSQERWAAGGRRDLELDDAETGIGDLDGLLEQVGTQDWQQGALA